MTAKMLELVCTTVTMMKMLVSDVNVSNSMSICLLLYLPSALFAFCSICLLHLLGVNFRPLQEIEAIMGGGQIFDTGPFFGETTVLEGFRT